MGGRNENGSQRSAFNQLTGSNGRHVLIYGLHVVQSKELVTG